MRVTCPCCKRVFSIGHGDVLREAERLTERKRGGRVVPTRDDVNGNVLSPEDAHARRLRDEAVARKMQGTQK